jgi:ATP-dependent exoDNAse (exonuclease V) beta subunit
MILTHEQLDIIYSKNKNIFIEALAGTGKTTTLIEFAKENFDKNILYIVFNKDLRKEVKYKFTANTEVHTINSFSYKYIDQNYNNIIDNLNEFFILNLFNMNNSENNFLKASKIIESFNVSMSSSKKLEEMNFLYKKEVIYIYKKMTNKEIAITHNALMKYFIDTYDFSKFNYDYILIDEAQDINPEMITIINKINAKKIFVGDIKQNIYGFRNSINIFNKKNEYEDIRFCKLTKSFRFGIKIAKYISTVTSKAYNQNFEIKGNEKLPISNIYFNKDMKIDFNSAIITRTNAKLFEEAFELTKKNIKVSIPFDWDTIKILISSLYYLKIGIRSKIEDQFISNFNSYEQFKNYFKTTNNKEYYFLIKIMEKFNTNILNNLKKLEQNLCSPKYADIILITAHKSKGLEFETVSLTNDFKKYIFSTEIEEKNLIYVAITRAKNNLYLPKELFI